MTDAHCHPTDLAHPPGVYDTLPLRGLAAMATTAQDQGRVDALSRERCWFRNTRGGVRVVACFGYHPWFTHRYTLAPPHALPPKRDHYASLFLPHSSPNDNHLGNLLDALLPFLPDPAPLQPLLHTLRQNLATHLEEGRLTMLGEVGLDASARLRWPIEARHVWEEMCGRGEANSREDDEWKRLTPFKVPIAHQRAVLEAQMEIAIELGVNISFHSVASAGTSMTSSPLLHLIYIGPTMDVLRSMKTKHGPHFTHRVNVDLHSAGGWSPQFWIQAQVYPSFPFATPLLTLPPPQKSLPNLYASPSVPITSRSPSAPSLIRAIARDRMLIESDTHDATLNTRYLWAATEWVGRLKGWKVEGLHHNHNQHQEEDEDWELESEEEEVYDHRGKPIDPAPHEIWTVRTLERNWARFMRLLD